MRLILYLFPPLNCVLLSFLELSVVRTSMLTGMFFIPILIEVKLALLAFPIECSILDPVISPSRIAQFLGFIPQVAIDCTYFKVRTVTTIHPIDPYHARLMSLLVNNKFPIDHALHRLPHPNLTSSFFIDKLLMFLCNLNTSIIFDRIFTLSSNQFPRLPR